MQELIVQDVTVQDVIGAARATARDPDATGPRTGRVRWFSGTRGYGLIAPDDGGPDVFVEHDAIAMDGFRTLQPDQCVEFVRSEDAHGPIAIDVRLC